jgi:DNA-binding NarL/FixJ family response regulator
VAERISLVIADDHPIVRGGLRGILTTQLDFEVLAEATNGTEAVELARRLHPTVVLMDLSMPEMNGVEATARIKAQRPETQILVLTTYDTDADIHRALDAGATGYLLKDASPEDLLEAIRATARGKPLLTPTLMARLLDRRRGPTEETLSGREIEVLSLVAKGANNKEVAKQLYISQTTVKSHLARIFDKLGVEDRTAAVTKALKLGILSTQA